MSNTALMNYSTRDFANNEDLQLYLERQDAAFSPEVTKLFTDAGMLRRVVTRIWNKQHAFRVGILFEYRDQAAYEDCKPLLEQYYLSAVEGLATKVEGAVRQTSPSISIHLTLMSMGSLKSATR